MGLIEAMENKWIRSAGTQKCHHEVHKTPARLGLTNMRDLFILVAVGVIVGSFLSFMEVKMGRRQEKLVRRNQLAANYGQKWRKRVMSGGHDNGNKVDNGEVGYLSGSS